MEFVSGLASAGAGLLSSLLSAGSSKTELQNCSSSCRSYEVDRDSLRLPDRCECSSSMAARARPCIVVHPSLDRLARSSTQHEMSIVVNKCRGSSTSGSAYSNNDPTTIEGKGVSGVSISSRRSSFSFSASTGSPRGLQPPSGILPQSFVWPGPIQRGVANNLATVSCVRYSHPVSIHAEDAVR